MRGGRPSADLALSPRPTQHILIMAYNGFTQNDIAAFHHDCEYTGSHVRANTITAISTQCIARDMSRLVAATNLEERAVRADAAAARIHALEGELRAAKAIAADSGGAEHISLLREIRDELKAYRNDKTKQQCGCSVQ